MSYPPFYLPPNYFQFVPESERTPSPSPSSSGSSCSTSAYCNKRSNRTSFECKCVIEAYRNSHFLLRSTKSSQGKRKVWKAIFSDFQKLCTDGNIVSNKNKAQVKEKWRSLLEKNISQSTITTIRQEETDFYDDIDEFMSESDSVNPRNVQQTNLAQNETKTRPNNPAEEDDYSTDKAGDGPNDSERKRKENWETHRAETKAPKKARRNSDPSDTDTAILKLLEAQQAAIQRAEEKDEKIFQALLKSQSDAKSRHKSSANLGTFFLQTNKFFIVTVKQKYRFCYCYYYCYCFVIESQQDNFTTCCVFLRR